MDNPEHTHPHSGLKSRIQEGAYSFKNQTLCYASILKADKL